MSDKLKTEAAAHTPEPSELNCYYHTEEEMDRFQLCVNACTGLTADQVAAIPTVMADMKAFYLGEVEAKLTAFNAMQKACAELIQGYACGEFRGDYNPSQRRIQKARAALELADACEVSKWPYTVKRQRDRLLGACKRIERWMGGDLLRDPTGEQEHLKIAIADCEEGK